MPDIEEICRTGIPDYDPWDCDLDAYYFDADKARAAVGFYSLFTLTEGERKPFVLEHWQQAIIGNMFGWRRKSNGLRRYRRAFILVPRKNGKTVLVAPLPLLHNALDQEPGAQVYFAAEGREQAKIGYGHCLSFARQLEDDLPMTFSKSQHVIEYVHNGGRIKAIPSEAGRLHGLNPSLFVADEIHAHKNRDLCDVLYTGMGARKQPLAVYITTADYQRESLCNELHDYSHLVQEDPRIDPTFLPVIYEAKPDDDWTSPEVWKRVNPNYGVTIEPEFLAEECRFALQNPSNQNRFKRLYLNIRTGQDVAWLDMEAWKNCPELLDKHKAGACYAGLDLGATDDLTALVLFWPETRAVEPHFFCPESKLGGKHCIQYINWSERNLITATPGNVTDYEFVRARLRDLIEKYDIRLIGYDPWNFRTDAARWVQETGWPLEAFNQNTSFMNEPSKQVEKLVKGGTLRHGDHPVLNWCANNAEVRPDSNGNIRIVKSSKSYQKIDGIVAMTVGVGAAMIDGWGVDVPDEIFMLD